MYPSHSQKTENRTHDVTLNVAVNVAVVGARGYAGAELCRLLLSHPGAKLVACAGSGEKPNWNLSEILLDPSAPNVSIVTVENLFQKTLAINTVFLATPAEVSMELAPRFLDAGISVIDLSGAFRLSAEKFEAAYGMPHSAESSLARAQYGLVPWAQHELNASGAELVANPGCYATSVLLALIPLLRANAIDPRSLVIDSKSGATGAGKKASEHLLFSELAEDFYPYKVGKHQHLPEIIRFAEAFSGLPAGTLDPHFVTHLLPIRRGISSGLYARLRDGIAKQEIRKIFDDAYAGYPLLTHGLVDEPHALSLRRVTGAGRTHIAYTVEGNKLYAFSMIDNLLKGAASQAIENFNRIYGLDGKAGIL